jgi:predicted nucleotide-binding protein
LIAGDIFTNSDKEAIKTIMQPHVFIGSSSEGLPIAYALQNNLENNAEITVWTQDVFRASEFILESLLKQLTLTDFGIFVFSLDDILRIRGVEQAAVRDNVIFEFGLFVGCLGRENSIIVAPKGERPHLPSDLLGVNVLQYQASRGDGNLDAAVGPVSDKIRKLLAAVQPKTSRFPQELNLPFIERRDQLSGQQREILAVIESRTQCPMGDLTDIFDQIPASELHYRLEQLRLLMFIDAKTDSPQGNPRISIVYALSDLYKSVRRERIIGLTSSPPLDGGGQVFP